MKPAKSPAKLRAKTASRRPAAAPPPAPLWDRIAALMDAATLVNSSLDLDTVLRQILLLSMRITQAEASSILLIREGSDELTFLTNVGGGDPRELRDMKIPIDKSLAGWVIRNGRPLRIDDASKDERFYRVADQRSHFQTRSLLAVPLRERGRITGAVQVLNKSGLLPFDEDDERMLATMADQAGTAVDNSRTYARLLEEKRTLETIVDSLADAILVTDADGSLRLTNAAARRLFDLDGPAPRKELLEVMLGNVAREAPRVASDMVLLKPLGRILSSRVTPIPGPDGAPRGVVAALRDMTHAREGQRRRDEFFAVGVHELDNALQAMGRQLETLPPDLASAAGSAMARLRRQLDNLIRFSDIEAGPARLLRRKTGLFEFLASALAGRPRLLPDVTAPVPENMASVRLYVDVGQLKQALGLVLDTCEALAGPTSRLQLSSAAESPLWRITIAGTGGVAEVAAIADTLDARRQVERFLGTAGLAIDLGLAFARHVLESHGGRLDFEANGRDFAFVCRIPIDQPAPREETP